jgi:hypothetical protein
MAKNILVVGDWMIDEDWVLAPYRSFTSSAVGGAHFRVLTSVDEAHRTPGGAARTASILSRLTNGKNSLYKIHGRGLWRKYVENEPVANTRWDDFEQWLFLGTENDRNLKHDLEPMTVEIEEGGKKKKVQPMPAARVYRTYAWSSGEVVIRRRIDWIEEPKEDDKKDLFADWIGDENNIPTDIDAVVIHDNGHGVITKKSLQKLTSNINLINKPWFVWSKFWILDKDKDKDKDIKVAELLKEVDLRLLVVPRVRCEKYLIDNKIDRWLGKSGCPTRLASEQIKKLTRIVKENNKLLVVLQPDDDNLFTAELYKTGIEKFVHRVVKKPDSEQPGCFATLMFPYLVNELIRKPSAEFVDLSVDISCERAWDWMKKNTRRIKDLGIPEKKAEGNLDAINLYVYPNEDKKEAVQKTNRPKKSEDVNRAWDRALENCGIIAENSKFILELWRAQTEVDDYVCLDPYVRRHLRRLVNELRKFSWLRKHEEGTNRSVSAMVYGRPGDGKTFLAKKLAEMFDMQFLPFNITQMVNKEDIFDCFHAIAAAQAANRKQPALIFVDEINGTLESQHVYDAFLAPLDEGVFIYKDKRFRLDPCIWIFAGTRVPGEKKQVQSKKLCRLFNPVIPNESGDDSDKGSDFLSRLTLKTPCILNSGIERVKDDITIDEYFEPLIKNHNYLENLARTENVYLCTSFIGVEYPDVAYITEKALWTFYAIKPDTGLRDFQRFIRRCDGIRHSVVDSTHLYKDWLKKNANLVIPSTPANNLISCQINPNQPFDEDEWGKEIFAEGRRIQIVWKNS